MDEVRKVHILAQELIPIVKDIEPDARKIVMDHIENCESCQKSYSDSYNLDMEIPDKSHEQMEIKPLKKLVQFNKGIKLLLIMIRVVILSYVIFSSLMIFDLENFTDAYPFIQSTLYIFYLPTAIFLLVFTFVFLNKKWLFVSLVWDVVTIFSLDFFLKLMIF